MERYERIAAGEYEVVIYHYQDRNGMHATVKLGNTLIASQHDFSSHPQVARWARRKIGAHRKALRLLTPKDDPKDPIGTELGG